MEKLSLQADTDAWILNDTNISELFNKFQLLAVNAVFEENEGVSLETHIHEVL